MKKYIIASFLGGISEGTTFEESRWPLHVTLMRAIHSPHEEQVLAWALSRALKDQKRFELVGKSEELFGPENDRPVVELTLTPEVSALNALLKDAFASLIDRSVPDAFPTYRPHVTRQGEEGITVGDKVKIDSASLVLTDGNSRRIISTVQFA